MPAPSRSPFRGWRRWIASRQRALPRFLILGTQKGGTTSLYRHLEQHPQVVAATRKEVHYFDVHHQKGERWYRAHFPRERELGPHGMTGEGSPYYMCHPHAPRRIAELLPDARLVILLRNPVDRAISHYFHSFRNGREPLSLPDALAAEEGRIGAHYARMCRDPAYNSRDHRWYSYKARGHYREQLETVFEHFSREQVLIQKSEDFFADPRHAFRLVCEHIGLDGDSVPSDLAPQLVGGYDKHAGDPVRQSLREYFAPRNRELYELLGADFGWR
jgi:hypothetical protein